MSVDDPAYISGTVVSESEGWVGGWSYASHCGGSLIDGKTDILSSSFQLRSWHAYNLCIRTIECSRFWHVIHRAYRALTWLWKLYPYNQRIRTADMCQAFVAHPI